MSYKNLEGRYQSLVLIMSYFIKKKYKQQNQRILFYFPTSISPVFFIAIPSSRAVLQTTALVLNGPNLWLFSTRQICERPWSLLTGLGVVNCIWCSYLHWGWLWLTSTAKIKRELFLNDQQNCNNSVKVSWVFLCLNMPYWLCLFLELACTKPDRLGMGLKMGFAWE